MLYIDLRPSQTCHPKDGGSAYSIGVGELGWQYGTGLKSHGTVTNWCTGREWPVNCMTVISARWWSNMPFQRRRKCIFLRSIVGGGEIELALNYYITQWRQEDSQFGDQTSLETGPVWRQDVVEKASTQQRAAPSGLRLSNPGERERNADCHNSAGQYVAVLFGLQLPLTHNLSNKVRGIFF